MERVLAGAFCIQRPRLVQRVRVEPQHGIEPWPLLVVGINARQIEFGQPRRRKCARLERRRDVGEGEAVVRSKVRGAPAGSIGQITPLPRAQPLQFCDGSFRQPPVCQSDVRDCRSRARDTCGTARIEPAANVLRPPPRSRSPRADPRSADGAPRSCRSPRALRRADRVFPAIEVAPKIGRLSNSARGTPASRRCPVVTGKLMNVYKTYHPCQVLREEQEKENASANL